MKHLFAIIAVCGFVTGIVGCSSEEPAVTPDSTPELGDPGDLTETPAPDASGSTTEDDGPEIP